MMSYKTITARSSGSLDILVNKAIEDEWCPYSNVVVVITNNNNTIFIQTMLKTLK